jgi:hypothetical protein
VRAALVAAIVAAGCSSGAAAPLSAAPAAAPATETPEPVREAWNPAAPPTPWESDARWRRCAAEAESAARSASLPASSATGFAFDRGREPLLVYDAAAPGAGDVVIRFVDGVRRPVARLRPQALLSGEFAVPDDVVPLMARASLLSAAADRAPPEWVLAGGAMVAGGVFDRRVHERALGGPEPRSSESEIFGDAASDALAAAARVKALLRIARGDRPLARFVAALAEGKDEEAALAVVGVSGRSFLEAAAGTERARIAASIAGDAGLPALVAARAALARDDVDAAQAALEAAPVAGDPWIAADLGLCRAMLAASRGDAANARALLDAAPPARIVRVRERRVVEGCLAPQLQRVVAVRAVLADFPELPVACPGELATLLGVPTELRTARTQAAAGMVSPDPLQRRAAAVALAASQAPAAAPALRLLAADAVPAVRGAALNGLTAVAARAAADDLDAATHDEDGGVRRIALTLLAEADRARAGKRAAEMTGDADPAVRALAAELAGAR